MNKQKILVPVDFTPTSDQSIKQAISFAKKAQFGITLLHILTEENRQSDARNIASDRLSEKSEIIKKEGLDCDYLIAEGNIFDEIPAVANRFDHRLMLIGTHGIKGIKQKLFGADMLKLIRKIKIPCLVVQSECVCRVFNPIVFPVGGHKGFLSLIEATALLAGFFGSEVHIYSVKRKGDDGSQKLRENTLLATRIFEEKKIPYQRIEEEATVFSVGFAKQTLQYADKVKVGLISMMSVKTEEYYYFAQADKEAMINNEFNIPVLCSVGLIE